MTVANKVIFVWLNLELLFQFIYKHLFIFFFINYFLFYRGKGV